MADKTTRSATLTRQPSSPDGVFGDWVSDSGFTCKTVEKPWMGDETNISCIRPSPGDPPVKYLVLWLWSPKHKCNVYHVQDPTRTAVEIHSANLQVQLQGCIAPGASFALFPANAISTGIPETATQGVTSSVETIAKLEKDMQDDNGNQVPFYLTVQWANQVA